MRGFSSSIRGQRAAARDGRLRRWFGGGSGGTSAPAAPPPPPPSQPTMADTSRFLDQATFGVTAGDLGHVQTIGFPAYLAEQLAAAPSQYSGFSYTPHTAPATCQYHPATPTDASSLCSRDNTHCSRCSASSSLMR